MKRLIVLSISAWLAAGCGSAAVQAPPAEPAAQESQISYPVARTEDLVETLHGVEVADPYRWLEDDESDEVVEWQAAQTALARDYLDSIAGRDKVRKRVAELFRVAVEGTPVHKGEYYFQTKRGADQDQPVLCVSRGFPGEQRVLVDPNELGEGDNTVALDWWYPSFDGELLAYGLSTSGSERSTLYVMKTATAQKLKDEIPNTRSAKVAWLKDKSGFYYSRRPSPKSDETWFNRVFFHEIGNNWENDALVFGANGEDEDINEPSVSPDGKHLVISVYRGAGGAVADIFYRPVKKKSAEFVAVTSGKDAAFWADVMNDKIVVLTNYKASRYRVIEIDYDKPREENWREIIPQGDDPIDQILVVKDHLIVKVMHHAAVRLYLHDETGKRVREIELPALGRAYELNGGFEDEEFFYAFTSFAYAGDIYRHGLLNDDRPDLVSRVEVPVDPDRYSVEQEFFKSKDGTVVPMFVVRLANLSADSPRPPLLYGYGGFNTALAPYFLARYMPFIEAGGIFAMPNLRGGSEYGEDWHRAGMLANKQNTFDDFIAAAEHLIRKKITTGKQLVIRGGSNGGLLVGAAMVQRPDLFTAVVCNVPLLDMIRYHKFLIARLWVPEYGSSNDPEQFKYLLDYSPYHNVKEGVEYPATLLLTAQSDSRVAPLHARKFAAAVQAKTSGNAPILLHVETRAGHGKGKPISMRIEDTTDVMAFAMSRTGLLE